MRAWRCLRVGWSHWSGPAAQIPPLPLLPASLSPPEWDILKVHVIFTSSSLGSSNFTLWKHFFFFALCSFTFPPSSVSVAGWDLTVGSIQLSCACQGQFKGLNVAQLCELWVCVLCLQVHTVSVHVVTRSLLTGRFRFLQNKSCLLIITMANLYLVLFWTGLKVLLNYFLCWFWTTC